MRLLNSSTAGCLKGIDPGEVVLKSRVRICVSIFFLVVFSFLQAADAKLHIDDMERRVDIPSHPKRIVSLAPSITETLFALDLDREIVGVTTLSDYPEAARSKPRVGTFVNISLERVVSLNPDLVIGTADGNRKETVAQLERLGIPVYVVNPKSCEGIFHAIIDIGEITGKKQRAEEVVTELRKRIDHIALSLEGLSRPRVFLQIGVRPIVSVGGGTIHNELIHRSGGVNIYGDVTVSYPRCGIEDIVARKPDVIIVSSMKEGGDFPGIRDGWKRWGPIPAVRTGRIHIINSDLIDHASPRIVDGLERMAEIIHPDAARVKQ